jgi:hypothetical protein
LNPNGRFVSHPSRGPEEFFQPLSNLSKMGPSKPSMQELYASPEDWEAHRDTITRLYLHEKRSLQEVMEHMALNYFFFATCVSPGTELSVTLMDHDSGTDQAQGQNVQNSDQEMGH